MTFYLKMNDFDFESESRRIPTRRRGSGYSRTNEVVQSIIFQSESFAFRLPMMMMKKLNQNVISDWQESAHEEAEFSDSSSTRAGADIGNQEDEDEEPNDDGGKILRLN